MAEPASDLPEDDDLAAVLAAFGDDLRDILDEPDDDLVPETEPDVASSSDATNIETSIRRDEPSVTSPPENVPASAAPSAELAPSIDPVEQILEQYGCKLNDESNFAYAGSIALACLTAGESAGKDNPRFVVFSIGGQKFAVPMSCVIEVTNNIDVITPLPCTADWLAGITCLRGTILSVTDLAALFDIPAGNQQDCKMIVINSDEQNASTGIRTERVHGIKSLVLQPMPDGGDKALGTNAFTGMADLEGDDVFVIDPDQLFSSTPLSQYTH